MEIYRFKKRLFERRNQFITWKGSKNLRKFGINCLELKGDQFDNIFFGKAEYHSKSYRLFDPSPQLKLPYKKLT